MKKCNLVIATLVLIGFSTLATSAPDPARSFKKMDIDGNGTVSMAEFKTRMEKGKNKSSEEKIIRRFGQIAGDDGVYTFEEYQSVLKKRAESKKNK